MQNQGFRVIVQKSCQKIRNFTYIDMLHIAKKEEIKIMAAKKTAATKTAPVQTEEIVKVEETVEVEKKPAKASKAKAEKAEKEVAEKKPAAKRTTKKAVKTTFVVQAAGKDVTMEEAIERVKEAWTAAGNKATDLKEMAVYVKPEENAIYYVVNGDVTGRVDF